jgi:histidyl-tRNA synthetase
LKTICLIPEATALAQNLYNESWAKNMKKPIRVFYEARCYRYERPQAGRYREFTQFGIELMGGDQPADKEEILEVLIGCLKVMKVKDVILNQAVKRGLSYYIEDGFEVEAPNLGAQKQIVGGGRYKEGIGFAIGIDRVLLSL